MNPSASTATIACRKPSPAGLRMESLAVGLLLLGACLSVVIPNPSQGAENPTAGTETVTRPTEARSVVRDGATADGSPVSVIGILPTVVISADRIETEEAPEPLPGAVEVTPAAEIVPLAPLGSTAPIRP